MIEQCMNCGKINEGYIAGFCSEECGLRYIDNLRSEGEDVETKQNDN